MRARSFPALLSVLAAAVALAIGGCGGPEYAGVELPVIRTYAGRGGEVILHSEGHDLNMEHRLSRVIDDHPQELLGQ